MTFQKQILDSYHSHYEIINGKSWEWRIRRSTRGIVNLFHQGERLQLHYLAGYEADAACDYFLDADFYLALIGTRTI